MTHVFEVEDLGALHDLVWSELKKHGIKEAGRCRKPTKNSVVRIHLFHSTSEIEVCWLIASTISFT